MQVRAFERYIPLNKHQIQIKHYFWLTLGFVNPRM